MAILVEEIHRFLFWNVVEKKYYYKFFLSPSLLIGFARELTKKIFKNKQKYQKKSSKKREI